MPWSLPKFATAPFCPSEVRGSIAVPPGTPWWQRALRFAGPGLLVAVGYMDPGNWATDIAAGSVFGYSLLFVVLLSSLAAIVAAWMPERLKYPPLLFPMLSPVAGAVTLAMRAACPR